MSEAMTEREELLSYISDAYKDLNGSRPRADLSHLSVADLKEMADNLSNRIDEAIEEDRGYTEAGIEIALASGAGDRETAIRWLNGS